MPLHAGYAIRDITPPVGSRMAAFPRRAGAVLDGRLAEAVLDPLHVRALAIGDGEQRTVIIVGDVIMWRDDQVRRIRSAIADRTSINPAHVQLLATHTHSSGENSYIFGGGPHDPWIDALCDRAVDAGIAALADLQPARLYAAQVDAPINHNRLVPTPGGPARMILEYQPGVTDGPTDPTLSLLRFQRADGPDICWLNWTGHPVTLGPGNRAFSADFPGRLLHLFQNALPNTVAMFTNGAAGDIHPHRCMRSTAEARDDIADALAARALDAHALAWPIDADALRVATATVTCASRLDPSHVFAVDLAVLRLGPVVCVMVPGELFVEYQLELRRRLSPRLLLLSGYANDWIGYVPSQRAWGHGGYGVDLYVLDPPRLGRTIATPHTGRLMMDAVLRMINA